MDIKVLPSGEWEPVDFTRLLQRFHTGDLYHRLHIRDSPRAVKRTTGIGKHFLREYRPPKVAG